MTIRECTIHDVSELAVMNKQLIEDEQSNNPMSMDELEKRINILSHFHDMEHVELSHDPEVEGIFKGADEKLFYKLNNYIEEE